MKYKVVVIDDKPIIRQAIVQTIDWDGLRCTVVGQAEDGMQGKRIIEDLHPDILITDIKMPGLSGLDLAEYMQESHPASKTILITGYQEFEYARKALRVGAYDFIVKPIKNEELTHIVRTAIEQMEQKRHEERNNEDVSEQLNLLKQQRTSTMPLLRSKLISDMISGTIVAGQQLPEAFNQLALQYSRIAVVLVRTAADVRAVVAATAQELCRKYDMDVIEANRGEDAVIACFFHKALTPREARLKLQSLCTELTQCIQNMHGRNIRIAVSSLYKTLRDLTEALEEAVGVLNIGFFHNSEAVLFPEKRHGTGETGKFSIIRELEQFNRVIENSDEAELIGHLEQFMEQIKSFSGGSIVVVKGLLSDVCIAAAKHYYRATGDEFGLDKGIDRMLDDIYKLSSMKETVDYLAAFIGDIKRKLSNNDKEYSLIVKKVIDYINNRYADNISLTTVADHFGISSSYLSRLVRTETGVNFVDLVSKARIEAAKRLLADPKNKVNEVGEMVGYKEYAYFYQVFKRIEGVSPKEFKNRGNRTKE